MTRQSTDDLPDTRPPAPVDADTGPAAESAPDRDPDGRPRAKLLDLSLTQLVGGSMAAATAAALGSRLGVVGTIAGAAVLSIVSAIAASLYTNSMARAKDAVVLVRSRSGGVVLADQGWWKRPDRATTRRVLATTAAVFLIAAAFLAGLQLATGARVTGTDLGGRASSQVVRDDARSGTGENRDDDSSASTVAEPPGPATETSTGTSSAPTPTRSGTPAPEVTTPATGTDPTTDPPSVEATTAEPEATQGAGTATTPAGGTSGDGQ